MLRSSGVSRSTESLTGACGAISSVLEGRYSSSSATAPSTSSDCTAHKPLEVAWTEAPPSWLMPTSMPVNSATIWGPDTKATASELMTTRSERPSNSAGPETTGPVAAAITGTWPLQRAIALAARPHPCSAATPSRTSAPLDATKKTKGIPRWRAWSAASARRTPSAWVIAPRRMVPSERAMTALRPPIRPTCEVTAPTIPLPTTGATSTWVTGTECRPAGVPARGRVQPRGPNYRWLASGRRQGPERPPDFSHSARCSTVMVRSADLHMS